MSEASIFQQPCELSPGLRIRRGKGERGEPTIEVEFKTGFAKGEVAEIDPDQLQHLYCWLGNTVAWLRHARGQMGQP